ncbi:hypothetical protein SAMN05414139_08943 [Burkholderia sp. D7]|nr:hypothetical protein SAMN05414139_08943 [Burkholderia sp. D7]
MHDAGPLQSLVAMICPMRSKRGRPRYRTDIVLGIVDDYGSDYKRLHAVNTAISFSIHLIILIYFYVFLFKSSRETESRPA